MPQSLDRSEEILHRSKANPPLSKFAARENFGLQLAIAEEKHFPNADFPSRAHQAFPFVGIQLFGQQDLDLSMQKVACCRILRAQRLCPRAASPAVEPCREHARVVEYDQIAGAQEFGEVAESKILDLSGVPAEPKHSRPGPIRQRFLRDQLLGQVVMKFRDPHRRNYRGCVRNDRNGSASSVFVSLHFLRFKIFFRVLLRPRVFLCALCDLPLRPLRFKTLP